jgi:acetoin utilization protein AcuB
MMLVQDIMQTHVATATPETRLPQVLRLLERRGFRHVPVVDAGALVGIISDRDLKRAMVSIAAAGADAGAFARAQERLTAGEIMVRTVTTIGPMFPVEEAARLMVTQKISALPVTEGSRLVGIVTETDILHLFVRAMGVLEPSSRLDVVLRDPEGGLGEVVRMVEETAGRISSVMTLGSPTGQREIVLRVATMNPGPAVKALEAAGYAVKGSRRG